MWTATELTKLNEHNDEAKLLIRIFVMEVTLYRAMCSLMNNDEREAHE
jgi:hypothetical protein